VRPRAIWDGTSVHAGCGDGAEVERGVRGDMSLMSRGRGDVSEGFGAAV